eukprot:TRINITY_DN5262_c0_g1_i3.p1 TRINITY_DN5262_c0_g1~~TRINITY_DN5262_c0_g1_i3.p1  ORF type:complete len:1015 (-),score=201.91 TRINITY_DN5262_c0_g1_i3:408-3230(-)
MSVANIRSSLGGQSMRSSVSNIRQSRGSAGLRSSASTYSLLSNHETVEVKKASAVNVDEKIQLAELETLKRSFFGGDSKRELNVEQFIDEFGKVLGKDMTDLDLRKLFMKIDANSNSLVDWDEFSTYMMFEHQGSSMAKTEDARFSIGQQPVLDTPAEHAGRSMIEHIVCLPKDRYVTASRDGVLRLWDAVTLEPLLKRDNNKCPNKLDADKPEPKEFEDKSTYDLLSARPTHNPWVTDMDYLPGCNKVIVTSDDRHIRLYDGTSLSLDLCIHTIEGLDPHRRHRSGFMSTISGPPGLPRSRPVLSPRGLITGGRTSLGGSPQCATGWQHGETVTVCAGDDAGVVKLYRPLGNGSEWNDSRLLQQLKEHTDWVTNVIWLQNLESVISASLDQSLLSWDLDYGKSKKRWTGHTKGVSKMIWSPSLKVFITCGNERNVYVWNTFKDSPANILTGHHKAVVDVTMNEANKQLITMSVDKTIKVWDVRNWKCIETITDERMHAPEDRMSAMVFDSANNCLLTASNKLSRWPVVKIVEDADKPVSHNFPIVAALYNRHFHQIVSADESGICCVWDVSTGERMIKFDNLHDGQKLTSLRFDTSERRLVTSAHDGSVKVWNYNTGMCLKKLINNTDATEVSSLLHVESIHNDKYFIAAGWDKKLLMWIDDDSSGESEIWKEVQCHSEDITYLARGRHHMASASYDGLVLIWNLDSFAVNHRLVVPKHESAAEDLKSVDALLFLDYPGRKNENKAVLVTACADGYLRLYGAQNGDVLFSYQPIDQNGLSALTTDSHNHYLLIANNKGVVLVLDVRRMRSIGGAGVNMKRGIMTVAQFSAHDQRIVSIEYLENERLIVTSSTDCSIRLYRPNGSYIGLFGAGLWSLNDPSTFRKPSQDKQPEPAVPHPPAGSSPRTPRVPKLKLPLITRVRSLCVSSIYCDTFTVTLSL